MNKEKQVQVPESMLLNVLKLVCSLENYEMDEYTTNLKNVLEGQINAKFDQIAKRESFTAYKTAPKGTDAREQARQEYINFHAEMSKDFQTKKEIEI
jgi:hypothetical protein